MNISHLQLVQAPEHCGYQDRGRYEDDNQTLESARQRWLASISGVETPEATHVVQILVTGSGHSSTSWLMGFLADHPDVADAPVHDYCLSSGHCHYNVTRTLPPAGKAKVLKGPCVRQPGTNAASVVPPRLLLRRFLRASCARAQNTCYLPFLMRTCTAYGTRVVGLVRNPLDHWQSSCRRDPASPFHNLKRWVDDNAALAQHANHASLVRECVLASHTLAACVVSRS